MTTFTSNPYSIEYICHRLNTEQIILNTEWQRDIVWTIEQQKLLIDSIMKGYHIPELVFSKQIIDNNIIWQSLDGKQRCTSFLKYKNNEFRWDNRFYSELNANEKNRFDSTEIACAIYSDSLELEQKIDIFNRIQKGIVLSHGEIIKSRTGSLIRNYIYNNIISSGNELDTLRENLQIARTSKIVRRHNWLTWLTALFANYLNSIVDDEDDENYVSLKYVSTSSTKLIPFIENHDSIVTAVIKNRFEEQIGKLNQVIVSINETLPNFFKKNRGFQNILPIFHSLCRLDSDYSFNIFKSHWISLFTLLLSGNNDELSNEINIILINWGKFKRKNISPTTISRMQKMFNDYSEHFNNVSIIE